ncbi:MAG: hypothetical protein H8E55_06600 [Pelagibacterales bacterium]|nr:hypothetical protein [Pelagibacterales bacterium]
MSIPIAASALVAHIAIIPIIKNIYPVITTIKDTLHSSKVVDVINERDIEATLQVLEGLFDEIEKIDVKPKSLSRALNNLGETLKTVHNLLEVIHTKTIEHSNKWFSSWRTLDIACETSQLEIQFNLLEKRFNLLHKLLLIYNDSSVY